MDAQPRRDPNDRIWAVDRSWLVELCSMEFSVLSGPSFIRMLGRHYRSDNPFARTARIVAESLATPFGGEWGQLKHQS